MSILLQLFLAFPSNLVFLPIAAVLLLLVLPEDKPIWIKGVVLSVAVLEFFLSLHIGYHMQNTGVLDQFVLDLVWIQTWHVHYMLAVDGVSALMLILTSGLMITGLIGTWNSVTQNIKLYSICLMLLLSGMMGVFLAVDLFLFFVFWELMLVPMYLLIGIWGGEARVYASLKFVLYTMAGSVLMLLAIIYLYFKAGHTFSLLAMYSQDNFFLSFHEQLWLFAAMGLAFAIKVPLFPFHTWLPDAHVQAPTMGSVLLAGILLKMGVYGFFRFAIPLFPQATYYLQPYLMGLAAFGVVYGALVAMVQTDIKKLIAYSSVSHMGVVMLGVFSLNQTGMTGGLYQMLNHGVSTGALFLMVGMLYDRTHTRKIADYSGLAKMMPVFTVLFFIVTLSSIAVPLTNGFVGEFLTLLGSFQVSQGWTIVAATGVILGAVYMLTLFQNIFLGPVKITHGTRENDLRALDVLAIAPLLVMILWMGLAPNLFLIKLELPAETVLLKMNEVQTSKAVLHVDDLLAVQGNSTATTP